MPKEYADHLEDLWQRESDLAEAAADAGLTPKELLRQRKADASDRLRDMQRDADSEEG